MQSLSAHERSTIIEKYAQSLLDNSKAILEANKQDLDLAKKNSNYLNLTQGTLINFTYFWTTFYFVSCFNKIHETNFKFCAKSHESKLKLAKLIAIKLLFRLEFGSPFKIVVNREKIGNTSRRNASNSC